jgi:hypothetical protein
MKTNTVQKEQFMSRNACQGFFRLYSVAAKASRGANPLQQNRCSYKGHVYRRHFLVVQHRWFTILFVFCISKCLIPVYAYSIASSDFNHEPIFSLDVLKQLSHARFTYPIVTHSPQPRCPIHFLLQLESTCNLFLTSRLRTPSHSVRKCSFIHFNSTVCILQISFFLCDPFSLINMSAVVVIILAFLPESKLLKSPSCPCVYLSVPPPFQFLYQFSDLKKQ